MPNETKSNTASIEELVAATASGLISPSKDNPGAPMAIVPKDYRVEIIPRKGVEDWLPKPLRKTGDFVFADTDSFVRYFNEHKNEESRIFAEVSDTGGNFRGVLNFHGKESSFNDHVCSFRLRATHEWGTWCDHANKHMGQQAFATFLEENSDMFTVPTGAALLELITTLDGKANVLVNSAIKLQTGAIKLAYTEEIELKGGSGSQAGELIVPAVLEAGIAPFEGTTRYKMTARLRYRIESRKIEFWYQPVDLHLVVRHVIADILKVVEKQTGVVPFKT